MAIVKGPALSIDASGNVCGICYVTVRGQQIARCAWSGTPTPTPLQTAQKNRMVTAMQMWGGTLTEAERSSWRAAAVDQIRISRVKTSYIPSGYHYFLGLSVQILRQGFAIEKLPPAAMIPYGFEALEGGFHTLGYSVWWHASGHLSTIPTTHQSELWVAGPYDSGGYHAQAPDYRFERYKPLTEVNFLANPDNHKYYWGKYRWVEKYGRVGNWFELQVYVDF